MKSPYDSSPLEWLFVAVLSYALGLVGQSWFSESELISGGWPWTTTGGFDTKNFVGLLLQTFLLPLSGVALLLFAAQTHKHASWPSAVKAALLGGAVAWAAVSAWLGWTRFGAPLLKCGVVGCIAAASDDDGYYSYSMAPYTYVSGVLYFAVSLSVALLFAPLLVANVGRALSSADARRRRELDGGADVTKPLLLPSEIPARDARGGGGGGGGRDRPWRQIDVTIAEDDACRDADGEPLPSPEDWARGYAEGARARAWRRACALVAAFGLLYPLCLVLATILPDSWMSFEPSGLKAIAADPQTESWDHAGPVLDVRLSARLTLTLFPDIGAYYLFIYVVALVGVASHRAPALRVALHRRPARLRGLCYGELALGLLFVALMVSLCLYWMLEHGFDYSSIGAMTWQERFARTLGQLNNAMLGLLVLPCARNSVWSLAFGVPWEAMIFAHRVLGYLFLGQVFLHMAFWWKVYAQQHAFPHDIFAIQMKIALADDFTIDLIFVATLALFVCMGVLAQNWVRRNHFELFYWSHHVALAFFVAALWHATGLWYYLLPGLTLWFVDRAIRFERGCARVAVRGLSARDGVVSLAYLVEAAGAGPLDPLGAPAPLRHEMGQYVFLNVPAISKLEWHPFTISSAPGDRVTTHHIRSMGPRTFTGRLEALATEAAAEKRAEGAQQPPARDARLGPADLVVNVDGPYGLPTEFERYDEILFVGGGIGVTPLHSSFRALYALAKHNPAAMPCARVRLVWCARTPEIFELFAPTFHDAARDDLDGKFGVSLYCDMAPKDEFAESDALPFEHGRPDLAAHIAALAPRGMRALVFVCSVPPVAKLCSELTMKHGVDFHSETFFF